MTIAVGKPNYSGNSGFERPPFFKLGHKQDKDRVLITRIGPPVGDLAERGVWSRFLKQHFGYTISVPGKNGEKRNIPVTFNCVEERDRDRNVTQKCPECEEIAAQKAKLEAKTQSMKAAGKSEEEIDTACRFMKSWLKDHNLDKKWHMVAKDVSGRWGFLTVSHSCYKLLKGNSENPGIIDRLVAKGADPLGVEKGIWFKLVRTGTHFNEIKDLPEIFMEEKADEPGSYKLKYDALTDQDLEQIAKLPSLDSLGRPLTFDQIKMLVENGGDEEIVRSVMNLPRQTKGGGSGNTSGTTTGKVEEKKPADGGPIQGPGPDADDEPTPEPDKKVEVKTSSASAPSGPGPTAEDLAMAALQKQMDDLKAKQAAAKAAAAAPKADEKPANKGAPTIKDDLNLPMEEFLKKFGNTPG